MTSLKESQEAIVLRPRQVAKILDIPPPAANASHEENIARTNAINVFRHVELIDRALGEEAP